MVDRQSLSMSHILNILTPFNALIYRLRQTTRRPRSTMKGGQGSQRLKGEIPLAEIKN